MHHPNTLIVCLVLAFRVAGESVLNVFFVSRFIQQDSIFHHIKIQAVYKMYKHAGNNGTFGCHVCLNPGTRIGSHMYWPSGYYPLRIKNEDDNDVYVDATAKQRGFINGKIYE